MNCGDVKQLLLSYLDNELNPLEVVSIEDHLSACPDCREELEVLAGTQKGLRQAFKTMAAPVSPSPDAWENIRCRLAMEEHGRGSILSPAKSKVSGWIGGLKLPRPAWQALGALSVALLIVLALIIPSSPVQSPATGSRLARFSSYEELKEFVSRSTQSYNQIYAARGDTLSMEGEGGASSNVNEGVSEDYSTTNIQVEGVDEADIVKTDGEFIYLASNNRVVIARAYPAEEAQILTEITLANGVEGIFVNGDRLVIIHQNFSASDGLYYGNLRTFIPLSEEMPEPQTYIKVYDVSDRANPVLAREMSIDGSYFSSRMVGNYVYIIINASAYDLGDEIELPVVHLGGTDIQINATDIYYNDLTDNYYSFTTIAAVNIKDDDREPEYETILLGATSNLYVSLNNIYVASTVWSERSEKTTVHRIRASGGEIAYKASGEVPGGVLNQFSMDEHDDFFRIATTTESYDTTSKNHLYILDMGLDIVASLEDLAPGEEIYSARFMGDRAYIVTFRQVDPLFVIDLTDPYAPEVLGELKITGYSDYLHPYDENHLIGIGKEATITGLFQGVKISLFDVSDVSNPEEIAKYEIGGRGTESPVLDDHKALLFDRSRNLLVMPVLVAENWDYTCQGAYVFHISPEEGLVLRGTITHLEEGDGIYSQSDSWVNRSLYIDDVLYTFSDVKIGMNDLESLDEIGEIELP